MMSIYDPWNGRMRELISSVYVFRRWIHIFSTLFLPFNKCKGERFNYSSICKSTTPLPVKRIRGNPTMVIKLSIGNIVFFFLVEKMQRICKMSVFVPTYIHGAILYFQFHGQKRERKKEFPLRFLTIPFFFIERPNVVQ